MRTRPGTDVATSGGCGCELSLLAKGLVAERFIDVDQGYALAQGLRSTEV